MTKRQLLRPLCERSDHRADKATGTRDAEVSNANILRCHHQCGGSGMSEIIASTARRIRQKVPTGSRSCAGTGVNEAVAALYETDAPSFLADLALEDAVLGLSTVVVRNRDITDIAQIITGRGAIDRNRAQLCR